MKKLLIIAALAVVNIYNLAAQNNNGITVFTEGGEPFYLILNGVKQNAVAATNVKATGLNGMQVKGKVIFDQKGIADCDHSIPMMWGGENVSNTEFVFSIHKDKKGNYKWKFVSQAPLASDGSVSNVNTNTNTNTVTTTNTTTNTGVTGMNTNINTNMSDGSNTNTTMTTNTTATGTGNGTGMNVNMGVNGTGVNMNVSVNDGTNMNSTATTTTTTSYSTSTSVNGVTNSSSGSNTQVNTNGTGGNVGINMNVTGTGTGTNTNTDMNTNNNVNTTTNTNYTNATSGGQCGYPMADNDFADAKRTITAKDFEDTKMTIAKQVADNNCLNVDEIKGIMGLFSFEKTKLDFAKYCYVNCYDRKNYYKMSDAFEFEASTTELNEYIKGK